MSQPVVFTPSESAAGVSAGTTAVKFTVTITNDTGKSFDASTFSTSAQSGTTESEQIYDGSDLGGSPTTRLLPGRSVTYKVGYSVSDPKDVVFQVTPGFDYKPAMFQS